jgi:hypothetical protein
MATKPIENLTTEEQATFRSEIGAVGTASEITAALGIPVFADLAAANASPAIDIGKPFYNTALSKLDITTA